MKKIDAARSMPRRQQPARRARPIRAAATTECLGPVAKIERDGETYNDWGGGAARGNRALRERQKRHRRCGSQAAGSARQVATTKVEGTGKLSVDVNAPKGTNVGAEGGGLFKKVEINRQTQMSEAPRGPKGGYATEALVQ